MLLRKLTAAFGPLLLCLVCCGLFRLLDGLLGAGLFWAFFLKGVLLGACVGLTLPLAGVKTYANGLTPWLYAGAGTLLALLVYQYLETVGVVHSEILLTALTINGQVVLVESTVMGFMALTTVRNPRRKA